MSRLSDSFNRSAFARFINSPGGRVFRLVAGAVFLAAGWTYRETTPGKALLVWSVFPLSAGAFDVCFISAVLGGPLSGCKIREIQQAGERPEKAA